MSISLTRRTAIAGAAVAALATTAVAMAMPAEAGSHHAPKPTIVLVHGAFADSSSWNGVINGSVRTAIRCAPLRQSAAGRGQ